MRPRVQGEMRAGWVGSCHGWFSAGTGDRALEDVRPGAALRDGQEPPHRGRTGRAFGTGATEAQEVLVCSKVRI